jgi:pyridoxal phosphate enzyme (YggS family)
MSIKDNLYQVLSKIPPHVRLVAVSKTKTVAEILEVYNEGIRDFGENKVQELLSKMDELPKDIRWHLIGHLQTNKIKYIAPFIHCIQSVDSLKLLKEINKEALKNNRVITCFLQVYIAQEETKFGFSWQELVECIESDEFKNLKNISIGGVMGMATYTFDEKVVLREFSSLKEIFGKLKQNYFSDKEGFKDISMGMSSDFELAISSGSTIVRVGSSVFGERPKKA